MTQINRRVVDHKNQQSQSGADGRLRSESGQRAGSARAGLSIVGDLFPQLGNAIFGAITALGEAGFAAYLSAKAGSDGFTSVAELRTALSGLGIKADDNLLTALFETALVVDSAGSGRLIEAFAVSPEALASLIWDSGPSTANGQTTPGVLNLTPDAAGGLRLVLSSGASNYDKLRFAWTGAADVNTLKSRLAAAGYRVSDSDVDAFDWLKTRPDGSKGKVSWVEVNRWATHGALRLRQPQAQVFDAKNLIDLSLTGGKFSIDNPKYADSASNPAVIDKDFVDPLGLEYFRDDKLFSQRLLSLGFTVDPTQLGLFRNTVPSGKLVAGVAQLNAVQVADAVKSGVLKYEFTDDGKLQLSLAEPNVALKAAIGKAPGLAGKPESVSAVQLAGTLNGLTGTQPAKLSTDDAKWLIDNYVTGGTGSLAQRLQEAVDAGALTVSSPSGSKTLGLAVNRPEASDFEVDPNGAVSAQVSVAAVRTPVVGGGLLDAVYNKNLFDVAITNLGQFADRYNETDGAYVIGATQYRADRLASGQVAVEMAVTGTDQWATVFTGGADSVIKAVETYEWDVGGTGAYSAKGSPGEEGSETRTGGGYSRLKVFKQFWVFEKDKGGSGTNNDNDIDNKSFRSRTYFPFPVITGVGGAVGKEAGGSLAGNYWVDLRWGAITGTPAPTNPARLIEAGVNFNAGVVGAGDLIKHAAAGDWNAVAQDAASLPRLGVQLAAWTFGLFGLKAGANTLATKIEGAAPPAGAGATAGSKWYRSVPADVVRFLGDTFQHSALVVQAGATGSLSLKSSGASAAGDSRQKKAAAQSEGSSPVPEPFASLLSAVGEQPDLGPAQAVFDALENVDLSKYGDVIGSAKQAITAATALQSVKNLLKGHGLSSLESLGKDKQNQLFDLVMEEATRLMLEDSLSEPGSPSNTTVNPLGPAGSLSQDQQQKNLLMNPGETAEQYVRRLMSNLAEKLPQAAINVLSDATTYDVDLKLPKPGLFGPSLTALAAAVASVVALLQSAGKGTNPAKGNTELINALTKAKTTLGRAQALVKLITEGGPVPDQALAIDAMRLDLVSASVLLRAAVKNNPKLDPPTKAQVDQVLSAMKTVSEALTALRQPGSKSADTAVDNMIGLPAGTAAKLPDDLVQKLLNVDPKIARALHAAGYPPELIARIGVDMVRSDLTIQGFFDVLKRELPPSKTSATDADIDKALLHARNPKADPEDLDAANARFGPDLVKQAMAAGFTLTQILTARSKDDLQDVLNLLKKSPEKGELFTVIQSKLKGGWTLTDIAGLTAGAEGWSFAAALSKITLIEARSGEFRVRFFEGLEYLQGLFNSDSLTVEPPAEGDVLLEATVYARYYGSTTVAERQRPSFLHALVLADDVKSTADTPAQVVAKARAQEEKF